MRKERIDDCKVARLELNEGQLPWLPRNPRLWTQDDIDGMKASIAEDPDFISDRPVLAVPAESGDKLVVFAHNLYTRAVTELKIRTAPVVVYYPETDTDRETIRRRAMKDNGSLGSWDWEALANEWDDLPLTEWGIPAWPDVKAEDGKKKIEKGLTTEGRERAEGYNEFLNKFNKDLPVTTDDCYTPPEVYDIIRNFVDEKILRLEGREVVRPFYPGGNYEDLAQYPDGCVVLDNPPFSIYSKIVRFYVEHGIRFFLFGPSLTLVVQNAPVTYVVSSASIVYENGAVVRTGFVTNLIPGIRVWVEGSLQRLIAEAQKTEPTTPIYEFPPELWTSATLQKIANGGEELLIRDEETAYVRDLDAMKEFDKGLFGGGFLLSRAAAEKARAAAEKARAAAEKVRAVKFQLSEREKAIVAQLDKASAQ